MSLGDSGKKYLLYENRLHPCWRQPRMYGTQQYLGREVIILTRATPPLPSFDTLNASHSALRMTMGI